MIAIFDEIIKNTKHILEESRSPEKQLPSAPPWKNGTGRDMVLRSDMAYELGGGMLPALGGFFFSSDLSLTGQSGVTLLGPDLPEIRKDMPYARLTFIGMDSAILEDQAGYDLMKQVEYQKYRMALSGFMMRISSSQKREAVRVSKQAVSEGVRLARIGSAINAACLSCPGVKRVQTCFITASDFDYPALAHQVALAGGVLESMNQIFRNVQMDCQSCGLRQVCEEVEGLKELHFAQKK